MFINNGICWGWFSNEFCDAMETTAIGAWEEDDVDNLDNDLYNIDCSFCCM